LAFEIAIWILLRAILFSLRPALILLRPILFSLRGDFAFVALGPSGS